MLAGWKKLPVRIVFSLFTSRRASSEDASGQLNLFDLLTESQRQEVEERELDLFGNPFTKSKPVSNTKRKNIMNLDYDKVMTFLAETPTKKLVQLANNPLLLEKVLSKAYSRDWGSLEPDTLEAQEAATADGMRDALAEERIYHLLIHQPKTWETFKAVLKKLEPDSAIAEFLDRYHKSDLLLYGWEDPSEEAQDETM